jgi:hypothetical protein
MLIVPESGRRQLTGNHSAAKPAVALEDHHLSSGDGQVGRGNQPVVARSHRDYVK